MRPRDPFSQDFHNMFNRFYELYQSGHLLIPSMLIDIVTVCEEKINGDIFRHRIGPREILEVASKDVDNFIEENKISKKFNFLHLHLFINLTFF